MWGMIAQMAGGMIAQAQQQGDIKEAKRLYAEAVAEYGDQIVPHLDGVLKDHQMPETAFNSIKEDSKLIDAERGVLSKWEEITNNKGNDAQFQNQMAAAARQAQGNAASNQRELQRGLGERGLGSGGLAMAMAGNAAAASSDMEAQMGSQAAAEAQRRYLQALESGGNYASKLRGEDYRLASDRAQATDAINKFNTTQRVDAQQYANDQAARQFQMEMSLKNARANAMTGHAQGNAQFVGADAKNTRDMAYGAGVGLNSLEKYWDNQPKTIGATEGASMGGGDAVGGGLGGDSVDGGLSGEPNRPANDNYEGDYPMTTEEKQREKYAWLGRGQRVRP